MTGGSAVTGYEYRHAAGASVPDETAWTSAGTSLTATVASLANGTAYAFEVRAVNGAGAGGAPAATTATPATVPSAPQDLIAPLGDSVVLLIWNMPSDDGGCCGHRLSSTVLPRRATVPVDNGLDARRERA